MQYTKPLLITVVVLVIVIYIRYYLSYKDDYNILQTYLGNVDQSLLYEKYPIVIYDRIANPYDLLKTLFAYTYVFKKESVINSHDLVYNGSKYAVIWSKEHTTINVVNPKYKSCLSWAVVDGLRVCNASLSDVDNVQYITIKLKPDQVLILPAFWIFNTSKPVKYVRLDDVISFFV
jgi:hypothetical protein